MSGRHGTSSGLPPGGHAALIARLSRVLLDGIERERREAAALASSPAVNDTAPPVGVASPPPTTKRQRRQAP